MRRLAPAFVVILLTIGVSRPAAAQHFSATSYVTAGLGESPEGQDHDEGEESAFATASDSGEYGSGFAAARSSRADLFVTGQASASEIPGAVGSGTAFWYDEGTIKFNSESVPLGKYPAMSFKFMLSWSVTSGGYSFGVNQVGADWNTTFGSTYNSLNLGLGASGAQTVYVITPFSSIVPDPDEPLFRTRANYIVDMALSAGADAGGNTSSGRAQASLRLVDFLPLLRDEPVEHTEVVTDSSNFVQLDAELEDDAAFDYFSLQENDADFDVDGDVDGNDFLTWQRNVGIPVGALRTSGNANEGLDGDVDADDLAEWKAQFGLDENAAVPAVASVPEPATSAGFAILLLSSLAARHRRTDKPRQQRALGRL